MRTLTAVSFAVMLSAATLPAFASTSPDGAAAVKRQVEEAIAFPLDLGKNYGQGMKLSGAVEVTPQDDYYTVKLPGVQVMAGIGVTFDLGTITANVIPADDGSMKVSLSLPKTVRALDPQNAPIGEVNIGDQKFSGIWWPALAAFTQLDAKYTNITMTGSPSSGLNASVADLSAYVNLTKNADDTWSGPYGISGNGMKASISGVFASDIAAESFKADSSYDKVNLKARKDMQDNFSKTFSQGAQGQMTPDQASQMMSKMLGSLSGFLDGMSTNVELSGLSIKAKADPAQTTPATPPLNASIGKASINFDVQGMLQDKGTTTFKMKFEGLQTGETDPVIAALVPNNANFEVYVENLPMKQLGSTLSDALGDVMGIFGGLGLGQIDPAKQAQVEQQTQMQMLSLMTTIPAQLAGAGTKIAVRNTYTDAPEFDANLDGAFKANAASPMLADGKVTLSLSGLDELILKLQSESQGANPNPRLAGYATVLSMLQMQTKPETGADGKSVRKLVLEVSPEGSILLNGAPMPGTPGGPH